MKTKAEHPKASASKRMTHPAAKAKMARKHKGLKMETPYDRVKHLLGVLKDLPSDLSTNPKYFEGFGE